MESVGVRELRQDLGVHLRRDVRPVEAARAQGLPVLTPGADL